MFARHQQVCPGTQQRCAVKVIALFSPDIRSGAGELAEQSSNLQSASTMDNPLLCSDPCLQAVNHKHTASEDYGLSFEEVRS